MYCAKHAIFFRYGRCPKCLENEVRGEQYAHPTDLGQRWGSLTANPEIIDQDKFGVCGMTSAVYLLLKHDQNRAQRLYEATFADVVPAYHGRKFETAEHRRVAIKFRYLARRFQLAVEEHEAEAEPKLSEALKTQLKMTDQDIADFKRDELDKYNQLQGLFMVSSACFVDFCVARGLGYVFKKIDEARYKGEKTEFNLEFSDTQPIQDYRTITRFGNFALRTNNLAFILKAILGAQVHIASKNGAAPTVALAPPVAGVTSSTFSNVTELEGEFTNHFGKGHADGNFAVVSVFGDICQQGDHVSGASPAGAKPNNRLAYNHWVVFNGFARGGADGTCKKKHVNLKVWTWKKDHDINVCEEYLLSYIQDVIFGHF